MVHFLIFLNSDDYKRRNLLLDFTPFTVLFELEDDKHIYLCRAPSLWQRLYSSSMNSNTAPQASCHYIICIQVKAEE